MEEYSLPTEYDVIIVGTGMVESIVAAAVSRMGKKVLHIDRNDYYGQSWGTFNIDHFLQWMEKSKIHSEEAPDFKRDEKFAYLKTDFTQIISNIEHEWNTVETQDEEVKAEKESENEEVKAEKESENEEVKAEKESENEEVKAEKESENEDDVNNEREKKANWSEAKIKEQSRKFNLDITPKLLFAKGPMVKLLIASEVSRYLEFLNIAYILVFLDSKVEPVPYCKSDVFSTRAVTVVEKRLLMRVLTKMQGYKEGSDTFDKYKDKTFLEFLQDQKLSDKIVKQILHSIAMVGENSPCLEGVQKAQAFLSSLGFYGNSPFLWTMYGSCDVLQAFCRLSAVFGGTYWLDRTADQLILENNVCKGIVSNGTHFYAHHILISSNEMPLKCRLTQEMIKYKRAILITDKSLYYKRVKSGVSVVHFPLYQKEAIRIIELDSTTSSCPKDLFVVHLMETSHESSYDNLNLAIKSLFQNEDNKDENKPNVIYKCFFTLENVPNKFSDDIPKNIHPCSGPTPSEIDYQSSIDEAENIFKEMFPEEEFFGPLPPQEDEIMDEQEETEASTEQEKTEQDTNS